MKTCSKCGEEKPLEEFGKDKTHKDGHSTVCKVCRRKYYSRNREKILEVKKEYHLANQERILAQKKEYLQANREEINERKRDHYAENKEVLATKSRAYHAANRERILAHKKIYHLENREDRNQKSREYYHSHKEEAWARDILKKFGMTVEEYYQRLSEQEGRCALCLTHESEFDRRLAVDHCHETGNIRGLLCTACNISLGGFGDSISTIERVPEYLRRSKDV